MIKPTRASTTMRTAYAALRGFEGMIALRKGQATVWQYEGGVVGEVPCATGSSVSTRFEAENNKPFRPVVVVCNWVFSTASIRERPKTSDVSDKWPTPDRVATAFKTNPLAVGPSAMRPSMFIQG